MSLEKQVGIKVNVLFTDGSQPSVGIGPLEAMDVLSVLRNELRQKI
jgi:thymidine phosphorylase